MFFRGVSVNSAIGFFRGVALSTTSAEVSSAPPVTSAALAGFNREFPTPGLRQYPNYTLREFPTP